MSILTEFFVATAEDMNTLRVGQFLRDLFPALETNYVDSSKVEILANLVVENPEEQTPGEKHPHFLMLVKGALEEQFVSADQCSEEDLMRFDQWIERCDPLFVECLASFPATQVRHVATQWAIRWARFDGRPVNKDDPQRLSALLQQLCQLAKKAYVERKQLYLWTCL